MLLYKKATLCDLDILVGIRIRVLKEANELDDSIELSTLEEQSIGYYKQSLADETHLAYLVMDDSRFVGAGGISFFRVLPTYRNPTGHKAYIMNMYTEPEYWGKGIAYKTLGILVSEAKARGISAISLEATKMGFPIYEKFGFVKMSNEMELSYMT